MKITKFVHSCLLVEQSSRAIIVDPGNYSWQSGLVDEAKLIGIDAVVITHGHPDHMYQEFVEAINKQSPDAVWYGPKDVVAQLADWNISANTQSSDSDVEFIESAHADLSPWFPSQPDHTSYLLFGDVLIGGDCHMLTDGRSAKIFAGAVNGGPWGGVVSFAKMVEGMQNRPKNVVPLHDWHWNDAAREAIYERLPEVMSQLGVAFTALESGVTEEV